MKKTKIILITICLLFVLLISYLTIDYIEYEYYSNKETISNNKIKKKTNSLSIMLETGSNTNEYEASTSTSWPTDGYEFNKELSKCENGGELSFDEETKKLQLISDKPDKCYAYFDKYLEFYLNGKFYQAKPNMTWQEWLDSNYSDNWEYKSQLIEYTGPKENTCSTAAYYPYCLEKEINDNLLLVENPDSSSKESISALGLSKGIAQVCPGSSPVFKSCYTDSLYTINIKKMIIKQLEDIDALYSIQESNYYLVNLITGWCLSPETLIDVEEIDEKGKKRRRRKKLKDIKVGDKVICINPFTLELDTDTVVECDGQMNKKHTCYDNWYFSDGTIITTIHRHRFYNVEKNKFMYMEEWNIGEHGLNINNEKIELIKHEHIEEEINHCTLFTEKYNNYFANGLLSGNRKSKNIIQNR